ncbi:MULTISPECIES: DUF4238 domain-containing protein [Bacillus cereus group]|uniref:DUF4238 domain-containing protein n=3 Tax=Bacillus cereus group TaxID=86661 RepID=A0A9W7PZB4_BACCE|nr:MULTISPECIES: DUF4238 domain-containing protein [Bacillus cereus group]EEM56703.1 hypothetical protein bthur0007_54780 [Bacillus thuringiensis serovar monterrey BGSC 4AJ1]KAA6448408.1 DUF4238 domain-containing protein [Bacillus cereus]MEB9673286.1 DUF4238 domain-containing protein [Bacillus anthracis]OTW50741.1 hypothetical protein BK699_09305 [Bacillus thuringiensis serovar mexicanensis]OTX09426.1 hypothetical protein BK705_04350 [Bacillus thuringiensis serovar monterrey]
MAEKKEFVKKQHYIPRFSIKPFEITEGYCRTVILKTTPFKIMKMSTKNIMQENDLYEVKDLNGEYINRNEIEDMYSKIENSIAHSFHEFVPLLASDEVDVEFKKKFETMEWQRNETNLLVHLIFTLIRSPHLKNMVYEKKETPDFMKPIFYRLMTTTPENAVKLAKSHLIGDELEIALHSLKTSPEGGLQVLFEHLMNNFQLRIYKTRGEKKFFLSDRPILVNKFEEADYVLPIAPTICIGATPFEGEFSPYNQITYLSDDDVNRINKKIIENTEKMLIIQSNADLEFVKEFVEI